MTKPAPRKTLKLPPKPPVKKPPSPILSPAAKKIMSLGHPPRSKK